MSSGICFIGLTCNYYADLIEETIKSGLPVKTVAVSERSEYQPDNLKNFIENYNLSSFCIEDLYRPERFEKIYDPEFDFFDMSLFNSISYYKDLFLLMTDRNAFFPISANARSRLFNQYLSHFAKIIKTKNIDTIVFFGIPHGPWSIALWGLAKSLDLKVMYTSPVEISTEIITIETDIIVNREYDDTTANLGFLANNESRNLIKNIIYKKKTDENFSDRYLNREMTAHRNMHKIYIRRILSLFLKNPLSEYISSEFDLNINNRKRIKCVLPLLNHYLNIIKALNFYKKNITSDFPDKNAIVLFLHKQPEASTNPLGGYFQDQLFILDLLLAALPKGMNIFVKEHPWQYETIGEDKNERSIDFYKSLIKDKRVKILDRSEPSETIIEKAGVIISTCGTVGWQSIELGKASIVFGWQWYTDCKSCFVVDSVKKLREAIVKCKTISTEEVLKDKDEFISKLEKRIIYGVADRQYLGELKKNYDYQLGLKNIVKALEITFKRI